MARVISFKMVLDSDPAKERDWEYKALSLKISKKAVAKGKRPTFIVVEKGVGITQLVVNQDASGVQFSVPEKSEFSRADAERAVGLIASAMFQVMSERGVLDQVK